MTDREPSILPYPDTVFPIVVIHSLLKVNFRLSFSVPLSPVAFFPLNGQYETTDISHSSNPPGKASGVELAPGPDGSAGGSYQFSGNLTSLIEFPNNGGLDTRYSMTFLAWMYHEQTDGPIFYFSGPGSGTRFLYREERFFVLLLSSNLTVIEGLQSALLKPKTWHFVGASYSYVDREFMLWINGSLHKNKAIAWPTELATQQNVIMGATSDGPGTFKGRISCVQLYDRVLTELEVEDAKHSCFTAGEKFHSIFGFLLYNIHLFGYINLDFFL